MKLEMPDDWFSMIMDHQGYSDSSSHIYVYNSTSISIRSIRLCEYPHLCVTSHSKVVNWNWNIWHIWPSSPWCPQVTQSVLFHFVPLVCDKRLHRCSAVFYGALRGLGGNSSVESAANLRLVGAFNRSWKSILWHQLRRSVESPLFLCFFLVDWRPPNNRRGRLASRFFLRGAV